MRITPKTCNNEPGYLCAVFNELHRTHVINYANPLRSLRSIKISEQELTWLTSEQIQALLDSIDSACENPHMQWIVRICLATGARWGYRGRGVEMRHRYRLGVFAAPDSDWLGPFLARVLPVPEAQNLCSYKTPPALACWVLINTNDRLPGYEGL